MATDQILSAPQDTTAAPAISLATLRAVLAKGQAAHPELACRMERAALILVQRRIEPAVAPENVGHACWVEASDGSREHWVCLSGRGYRWDCCTCPDYVNRGGPCKHAIAVRLPQACERRERGPQPPPIPFPARTLADDEPIPYVLTDEGLAATADVASPGA